MHIEIISGSPRQESVSYRLALHLEKYITTNTQHGVGIIDVREWSLPLLQQQVYTHPSQAPAELQPMVNRMLDADAYIMVSPEYNGSYTAALKNLFDHFPKRMHKAFGIVTSSPGALGGIRASQQMQLFIHALFGIGSPYMLITPAADKKFDVEGNLIDPSFQKSIDLFVTEFLWLAEKLAVQEAAINKK